MGRLACLALCIAVGCATPIETRPWLRIRTPHFEIVSGADAQGAAAITRRLELLRAVLLRSGIEVNLEPRVPLLVYVFGDAEGFARFRPRSGLAGFMLPRVHRSFIAVESGEGPAAQETALHEYVHFVLRNGEATQYPLWYEEGLAELLSTLSVEGDDAVVGRIPSQRATWLRYGSPLGLRRMMTADDAYEWSDRALARFYAQAWALVDFFHVADRREFSARHAQMIRYIQLINRGVGPDEACSRAFETDFEGLEREFLRYLAEGRFPYLGVPLADLPVADEAEVGPLPEHEKRLLLGDLALALGERWRGEARRWFELALEARPQDARAHAALAYALAPADARAADEHFSRALALAEADPEVHRLRAESLLERAERAGGDAALGLAEQARREFRRSLELAPQQVAANAGLGRSYLVAPAAEDPAEGLASLRIAHERLPAERTIALELAELEARSGASERARALLARLPPPAHGDPASSGARSALERVRREAGLPPSPPRVARHLETHLEIATPGDGLQLTGGSGWIEVAGRGGLSESALHDVVIAIDESPSTLEPTGTDVDGDGEVGRARPPRGRNPDSASSDPGDSVIRAELEAARVLIGQLDAGTTRVGLVTFAGGATLRAELGDPAAALGVLDGYEVHVDPTGTSFASALVRSLRELSDRREPGVRRQPTILLLSDGVPTVPTENRGRLDATELADRLGQLGIPIHAFALGKLEQEDRVFFQGLAERSGGRFVRVERPAGIVNELARVRFSGLADVALRNETSGEAGRAVRVLADGSFDGFVPLVEGANVLAIAASIEGGRTLSATRTVVFHRPAEPSDEDRRAVDALRARLEQRRTELELLTEIRRGREGAPAASRRQLELEIERGEEAGEPVTRP